jgi:hypothetical protein
VAGPRPSGGGPISARGSSARLARLVAKGRSDAEDVVTAAVRLSEEAL